MKPTQTDRLIAYLRANPGSSSLEITRALDIVNVTGRISDARAQGYVIECRKGPDGRDRYTVIEQVTPRSMREPSCLECGHGQLQHRSVHRRRCLYCACRDYTVPGPAPVVEAKPLEMGL